MFPMEVEGLKAARVVEKIKHEVRKYVKRERKKTLPEGVDFCDFACRLGKEEESAEPLHLAELTKGIDRASEEEWPAVFIEIVAKAGYRTKKPKAPDESPSS